MTTPEPGDKVYVRTGDTWPPTFWQRDDEAVKDSGWEDTPGARWWDCAHEDGGPDGPRTWDYVSSQPELMLCHFTPWRRGNE